MREIPNHFYSLPAEYQNVLQLAQEKYNLEIIPLQELKGGKTGAALFLVSVSAVESAKIQHLILKLDHKNKTAKMDELERHTTVLKQSPPVFARNHIAEVAFERIEHDEAVAIFYSIAGQSLNNYKSLSGYQQQNRLEKIFQRTHHIVLTEWNNEAKFERAFHPQHIIERWLGYRLQHGGNIEKFIEDKCGIQKDTGGLMIGGNVYPNPLLYSRKPELWSSSRPIDIITGFQHGDLNIANILVKFSSSDNEITGYYLIDFALFKDSMPLFYDLTYLEMSYLIREIARVSFLKWSDMVSRFAEGNLIDQHQVPIELAGACSLVNAGRKTFDNWVHDLYPSMSDDLWGQYWLSAVAAGLNFCNKAGIPDEERLAGLIFASVHMKRYHSVFGITMPVEVKYVHLSDQREQSAATQVSYNKRTKHNLPSQTTAFIGRQKEIETTVRLLQNDNVRLVTLTGPGGTGKTRLAVQCAEELLNYFNDGVYFVDLAHINDSESVPVAIAGTLGLRESGNRPLMDEIKSNLFSSNILLLMDNFEQVISAAPIAGELLLRCPKLKLLITSREALRLRGEHILPVPALGVPHTDFKQQSVEQITEHEAVKLFVDRASSVKPDFKLTKESAPAVAEICLKLDGLPLAIELAAARINLFSPEDLLRRIEGTFELLKGGAQDLPARQKTLRDTINWSYDMLSTGERQLLAVLSVFSGCGLEALETIAVKIPELNKSEFDVLDTAASLINKSLVRRVDANTGNSRLLMLETIRKYAAGKLESFSDLSSTAHRMHAEYYAGLANDLKKEITGTERESTLIKAELDIENMKTAWRYWVAEKNLEQLRKLTDSLWLIYDARGWYYSTVDLTTDLLNVLSSTPTSPERVLEEIKLQSSLAKVLMSIKGCTPEVEKIYMHALDLCNKYGEIPHSFPILKALGGFYAYTADFNKSAYFGRKILDLAGENKNENLKIEGMLLYGYSIAFSGKIKEGVQYLEKIISYDLERYGSYSFSIGNNAAVTSRTTTALCLWMLGYPDRSLKLADESLSIAKKLKHPFSMAYTLFHTGLLHLWRQEFGIVLERANAALKLTEEYQFQVWKAVALCLHGAAIAAMGQTEQGLTEINDGVQMYAELKTPPVFWPMLLMLRAGTLIYSGWPAEGLKYIDEALYTIGEDTENPILAEAYRLKGDVLMMISRDNHTKAHSLIQQALEQSKRQQTLIFELRAAMSLNRLFRNQSNSEDPKQKLNEAYSKFTEGFSTIDLTEAQKLLAEE